jgi:hypothetical protein
MRGSQQRRPGRLWAAWEDDAGNLVFGWLRARGCLDFAGAHLPSVVSAW